MSSPHEVATPLFGRDKDLELLRAFVGQSSSDGGALVLSGAPGVGKTVLLEAVAAHSADAGLRVLRAAGAEFEADLSFSGLNQVLHPLLDDIEDLSPPQRTALGVALGLGDGSALKQPNPPPLATIPLARHRRLRPGHRQDAAGLGRGRPGLDAVLLGRRFQLRGDIRRRGLPCSPRATVPRSSTRRCCVPAGSTATRPPTST